VDCYDCRRINITMLFGDRKGRTWHGSARSGKTRTCLINPHKPRCCRKCVPARPDSCLPRHLYSLNIARRTVQHSTRCTGKRGNRRREALRSALLQPLHVVVGLTELADPRCPARNAAEWRLAAFQTVTKPVTAPYESIFYMLW